MDNKTMEKMNVKVEDVMYYLITLFYKTGCKYTCTETKLHKLASIVAFSFALDKRQLFENDIYKYEGCGAFIDIKESTIDRDIYLKSKYYDGKDYIEEPFDSDVWVPRRSLSRHHRIREIPYEVRMISEEVFRCFGSYSNKDLNELLNPIVEEMTVDEGKLLDLSKISSAICVREQNNEIEKYIIFSKMYNGEIKRTRLTNMKILVKEK